MMNTEETAQSDLENWVGAMRYAPSTAITFTRLAILHRFSHDQALSIEIAKIALAMHNRKLTFDGVIIEKQNIHPKIKKAYRAAWA